jgi:hypothetical protein
MRSSAEKRMTIQKEIRLIPENRLDEVKTYIETMIDVDSQKMKTISLKGIWKGKGFEKLNNIESDISSFRKTLNSTILEKKI